MKSGRKTMAYAFFLPFIICVGICVGAGVYPFGDNCLLHIDMYHQYCPFFTQLLSKIREGGSLMYSWQVGLGSDFISVFAYYLASPLNWLVGLFPKNHVIEFMSVLMIVKISLCGLSFYIYLKNHFKLDGNNKIPLVFSTAYALSGFVAAYSWNIMWMDSVALTPLIILGLEKLVKENKVALYYITLAVSILSNYYISIMICIFLVFYFIVLFFRQSEGRWRAFFRFSFYSVLAGGTGVVLLLPEMIILGYSGSEGINFPETVKWYFNIIQEMSRMCTTGANYTGADHWPNLYTGAFTIILLLLYAMNKRISKCEKIPYIGMIIFFLLSFSNNYLDFFWHGLHFPNSLPGRQAFLFSFLILVLGYSCAMEWKGNRIIHVCIAMGIIAAVLVAGAMVTDSEITDVYSFIITGLFVAAYSLLLVLLYIVNDENRNSVVKFICLIAIAELTTNMACNGLYTTSRVQYTKHEDDYEKILDLAKENDEQGFYRIEDTERLTKNDDSRYGYASTTQFSSLMNVNVSHFFQSLYMEGGKNFYCYNGSTPITSAMLSVRYFVSDSPFEESSIRSLVGRRGDLYLYENKYCLPIGFVMKESAVDALNLDSGARLYSLNSLGKCLGAENDMLSHVACDIDAQNGETTITFLSDGYFYASSVNCESDSLSICDSKGRKTDYSKTTHTYLFDLGEYKAGESVTITNKNSENISFNVYQLDFEAVEIAYNNLNESLFVLDNYRDTSVNGHIDMVEDGRLIFSIPSECGWKLYVDGNETEIVDFESTFISVSLDKGEHEIELKYETPGLKAGALVSGSCVLLFVISIYIRKRYQMKVVQEDLKQSNSDSEGSTDI